MAQIYYKNRKNCNNKVYIFIYIIIKYDINFYLYFDILHLSCFLKNINSYIFYNPISLIDTYLIIIKNSKNKQFIYFFITFNAI